MPMSKEERLQAMMRGKEKAKAARDALKASKSDLEAAAQVEQLVDAVNREKAAVQEAQVNRARAPVRQTQVNGRAQVLGRNGEVLSRNRTQTGDIYEIPRELIPEGWDYQWCAVSVTGNTEILMDQNLMFAENGWRPVPASRHPGRFMPNGHAGSIVRGGQMLMERPLQLSQEAREEDIRAAHQLISDRNESLKLGGLKKEMGGGFEMSKKYRGTGGDIRMSIDKALDVPAAKYDLAED